MNLGYITNTDWAASEFDYEPEYDDWFSIGVQVELTEHPEAGHNAEFDMHAAVTFGNLVVVSKYF